MLLVGEIQSWLLLSYQLARNVIFFFPCWDVMINFVCCLYTFVRHVCFFLDYLVWFCLEPQFAADCVVCNHKTLVFFYTTSLCCLLSWVRLWNTSVLCTTSEAKFMLLLLDSTCKFTFSLLKRLHLRAQQCACFHLYGAVYFCVFWVAFFIVLTNKPHATFLLMCRLRQSPGFLMKAIGRHYCVRTDSFCLGKNSRGWVELLLAYRGARLLEFDPDGTSQIWSRRD